MLELNQRPSQYQCAALPTELIRCEFPDGNQGTFLNEGKIQVKNAPVYLYTGR